MPAPDPTSEQPGAAPGEEARPGVTELLQQTAEDLLLLLRQEFALARVELGEKVSQVRRGVIALLCGAVLALAALPVLLIALVFALAEAMPLWAAALLVALATALLSALLLFRGRNLLRARNLVPRRTIASLQAHKTQLMETFN